MAPRRAFGATWWGKRWIEVLESFGWENRLRRGRTYAREGNVLEMSVAPGVVTARVQGTRPNPYRVNITVKTLAERDWQKVIDVMAGRAVFAALLLAGEMPRDIEEAFREARLSLFPAAARDLKTSCSCPDWANPCKHIAAVYYLLGEKFDDDPFLLFLLRGCGREQLMAALRERRAARASTIAAGETTFQAGGSSPALEEQLERFWDEGEEVAVLQFRPVLPATDAALLRVLGPPPFWKARKDPVRALGDCYRIISHRAREEWPER